MPEDILRQVLERNGDETMIGDPINCDRCGKIFEGDIVDVASGRVLVPGHTKGDPKTCIKPGKPEWDKRVRRG